jgi:hypothetical protein
MLTGLHKTKNMTKITQNIEKDSKGTVHKRCAFYDLLTQ